MTNKDTCLRSIKNIYRTNLKVKKSDKVLIFTDKIDSTLQKITKHIFEHGKGFTSRINFTIFETTGSHGAEPPELLWNSAFGSKVVDTLKAKKLLKPLINKKLNTSQFRNIEKIIKKFKKESVDVVIALSYHSTSHTKFRDLLTRVCGTRYASMPLFDKQMLFGAMAVKWRHMADLTKKISQKVNKFETLQIETPNGTCLTLSKKGRKAMADTGIITTPGAFSNLPAGEVYLAPREGTAEGTLVLEWAPTRKLTKPIILTVQKGNVISVKGNEQFAYYLRSKLKERKENANIAELGIGTNNRATRPDNILESEKILGTIHIALGDNSTFGGKISTPFHQDFVFFKPTVTLITRSGQEKILLKKGKF
jgi:leucyl aminopeptidase (aminopeptidase T)